MASRRWVHVIAMSAAAAALSAGCSDDGDLSMGASPSTAPAPTTDEELFQRTTDTEQATTEDPSTAESGSEGSGSTTASATTIGPSSTVVSTADTTIATTEAVDDGGSAPSTPISEIPPALVGALLSPETVGAPADWSIRDAHTDEQLGDDASLAFGVLPCPLGPPQAPTDGPWLRRRFSTSDEPLPDGLVSIEIVAEVQSDAAFDARLVQLDGCSPGEFIGFAPERRDGVTPAGTPVQGATYAINASPSATTVFPSQHSIVVVHGADRTVTVAYSGVDMGRSWEDDALELADRVFDNVS